MFDSKLMGSETFYRDVQCLLEYLLNVCKLTDP